MDLTSFTQSPSSSISAFQSDFVTLLVGPDEENFTIHQDIITKARYFAGCLGYTLQESHTRIIRLPEDEPAVIAKVVEYLYSGKFEVKIFEDEIESHKEGSQIRLVVNSYIVADKYCMEHLQNMAMDLLRDIRFIGATTTLSMLAEANFAPEPNGTLRASSGSKRFFRRRLRLGLQIGWRPSRSDWRGGPLAQELVKTLVAFGSTEELGLLCAPPSCDWHIHGNGKNCIDGAK